jgi:hypothetical protein
MDSCEFQGEKAAQRYMPQTKPSTTNFWSMRLNTATDSGTREMQFLFAAHKDNIQKPMKKVIHFTGIYVYIYHT